MYGMLEKQNNASAELFDLFSRALWMISNSFTENIANRVSGIMPDFEAQNKKIGYELDAIKNQIESSNPNSELLDNINKTNRVLGSQFYEERIIEPMIRSLFPAIDLIDGSRKKIESNSIALKQFIALQTQLEQFFAIYGIERFKHKLFDEFDPKIMKPLLTATTDKSELDGLVVESLQCGFRTKTRILRLETVSIYKYQEQKNETSKMEEISNE